MTTDFGRRLKAARKKAGLTQKQLAPLAQMSQSNLSELETIAHGSSKTPHLAKVCGVNAHWLATGEGEMEDVQAASPDHSGHEAVRATKNTVAMLIRQIIEISQHLPSIEREVLAQYAAKQILNGPDPEALHMLNRIAHGDDSADLFEGVEPEPSWKDEAMRLAEMAPEVERAQLVGFVQRVNLFIAQQKDKKAAARSKNRTKAAAHSL